MNLAQELTNLVIQAQAHLPKDKLAVIVQTTEELRQSEILKDSLNIGDRVKDFTLPNVSGDAVELKQLLAAGPVVISFFRGTWCRFCNLELKALQDVLPEIQALGASLVAISPQIPDYYSMSTAQDSSLDFEVLSDVGNQVARNFGIVYQVPESLRPIMQGLGADLLAANGDETFELPIPATYVIAPDGTVAYAFVEPDFTKRVEPTQIIAVLLELQAGN
ncbi:Peroxiredoxin (plasmid) [Nostoc flagelliforme CCNUN1]|uniref:thioredoxin-dependent peroxiredoxin n=1 Tax=Nostoc flagelliforme CCNUN1 TaxID=2038116 RepID=A0A2K8TB49_9NOSO|nr:peroxiredoxin-like family protein [Nostoc flagelliforme]AUB44906.1 Peroxiredoxin [Nostoc flagelliforme CCNUN1]